MIDNSIDTVVRADSLIFSFEVIISILNNPEPLRDIRLRRVIEEWRDSNNIVMAVGCGNTLWFAREDDVALFRLTFG